MTTEIPSTANQWWNLAEKRIMWICFYHSPVESIESLDEDIHDLWRNFENIRVLTPEKLAID
jgi:hypothetical protein